MHSSCAAPRGWRGDSRQGQSERVGQFQVPGSTRAGARAAARRKPVRAVAIRAGRAPAPARRSRPAWRRGCRTETDGSIICPAAVRGLSGLKPTVGLVSRSGIIPISICRIRPDRWDAPSPSRAPDVRDGRRGRTRPRGACGQGTVPADYNDAPDAAPRAHALACSGGDGISSRRRYGHRVGVETIKAAGAEVMDVGIGTYGDWRPRVRAPLSSSRTASTVT